MVSGSPLSAEKWRADHPVLCGGTQDHGTIVYTLPKHASMHTHLSKLSLGGECLHDYIMR